jgi:4'-phosphopantetheinyl transferase
MAIDLWYAPAAVDQPSVLEDRCAGWLSDDEQARAARFRRPTTRHQFVVGRGMCRCVLGQQLACPPEQLQFDWLPHGKPQLAPPHTALQFNVAHTEGMVLCGVIDRGAIDRGAIGVDVERIERQPDLALAERYFAASEASWVRRQPEPAQVAAFLKVWTLKEALIKALGTGLATPLDRFAFDALESEAPQVRFLDPSLGDATHWQFFLPSLPAGYLGAVAVQAPVPLTRSATPSLRIRCFDPQAASLG